MVSVISFKNIYKKFGSNEVLKDLSFDVKSNEIIALIGKSGCGKSTLFKIFLGIFEPDSGKIIYKGQNLVRDFSKIQSLVGFVSQENSFYENLTVYENLSFFAKLYGVEKKDFLYRVEVLLQLVNLYNFRDLIVNRLSGGMKRRLEFAISLIHNPSVLILDEPFTGLDIKIRDDLWEVISQIKNSGVTVILSTHILSTAQKHADRVVFLNNKKIDLDLDLKNELEKNPDFDLEKKFYEVIRNDLAFSD